MARVGLDPDRYLTRAVDRTLPDGERKRIEALTRIFDALADFKERGATVIMITHDQEVLQHAEHVFLVCSGSIFDNGAVGRIEVRETARLNWEGARALLQTHIAVKDQAVAEVYNSPAANAVPIVKVNHPQAHITHEAAIGSVDSKQLQTLIARGLDEEKATDLIIEGLLG